MYFYQVLAPLICMLISMIVPLNSLQATAEPQIEKQGAQHILRLKGSPYAMGYAHGSALKETVALNVKRFNQIIQANSDLPKIKSFLAALPDILEYVPEDYKQEMKGLADGSQLPYDQIVMLNLFPEMFHCTGMTVAGRATQNKELYHVRVLDYAVGQDLQDTAVLLIVEPEGKIPFLNVSYAGFIGCITGMNAERIALGEIGGKGYGHYMGMPMAFLLRSILEKAENLNEVKNILTHTTRTCEYYYVFSDGKTGDSFGVYATGQQLAQFEPGKTYALFDVDAMQTESSQLAGKNEKIVLNCAEIKSSEDQTILYSDDEKKNYWGLIHRQPEDCLIITGFPNPQRYPALVKRIQEVYGKIGVNELREMIKAPVSNTTNLHNAIFAPATLDVWIAHAGPHGEPAYDCPYEHFNLTTLLNNKNQ